MEYSGRYSIGISGCQATENANLKCPSMYFVYSVKSFSFSSRMSSLLEGPFYTTLEPYCKYSHYKGCVTGVGVC